MNVIFPGSGYAAKAFVENKKKKQQIIKDKEDTLSFPDSWTQSYKWLNRKGERYHIDKMTYEQDPNAKVCVFHGNPNPHESTQEWVKKLWK